MSKKSFVLLAAAAMTALLIFCGDNVVENYNSPINTEATLNVLVRDNSTGIPVQGARVTLQTVGATASTAASGVATFKNVYVGSHKVKIEMAGYAGMVYTTEIARDGKDADQNTYIANVTSAEFNIYPLTSSLDGYLYYRNAGRDTAAVGATVRVTLTDNAIIQRIFETTTDQTGKFEFDELPAVGSAYSLSGLQFEKGDRVYRTESFGAPVALITKAPAHILSKLAYTTDVTPFIYLGDSPLTVSPTDPIVLNFSDEIDVSKIASRPISVWPDQAVELKYGSNSITLTPHEEWGIDEANGRFEVGFTSGALVSKKGTVLTGINYIIVHVLLEDISSKKVTKLELDTINGEIPQWYSSYAHLRWNKIKGATSYKIYAKTDGSTDFAYVSTVSGPFPKADLDTVFASYVNINRGEPLESYDNVFVVQGINARSQTTLVGADTLRIISRPTVYSTQYVNYGTDGAGNDDNSVNFYQYNTGNWYYDSPTIFARDALTPALRASTDSPGAGTLQSIVFYVHFSEAMNTEKHWTDDNFVDGQARLDNRIKITTAWKDKEGLSQPDWLAITVTIHKGTGPLRGFEKILRLDGIKSKNGQDFFIEYTREFLNG